MVAEQTSFWRKLTTQVRSVWGSPEANPQTVESQPSWLNLRQQFWVTFVAILVPLMLLAFSAFSRTNEIVGKAHDVRIDDVPGSILYLEMLDEIGDLQSNVHDYLAGEEDEIEDYQANYEELTAFLDRVRKLEQRPYEVSQLTQFEALVREHQARATAEVFDIYSPERERQAAREADILENGIGRVLIDDLERLGSKNYQLAISNSDSDRSTHATYWYLHLLQTAREMIGSVGEYVYGEVEESEVFFEASGRFVSTLASLESISDSPLEQSALMRIRDAHDEVHRGAGDIFRSYRPLNKVKALEVADQLEHVTLTQMETILEDSSADETEEALSQLTGVETSLVKFRNWTLIVSCAVLLINVCASYFSLQVLTRSLLAAVKFAEQISAGNFSRPEFPSAAPSEVQSLFKAMQYMSERVKAERSADLANEAKSRFLRSMSHEIRTPMNSVIGFSEIIARDKNLSSENKKNIDIVVKSGRHLLTLINDVLDLSKIESGYLEIESREFDLEGMLSDINSIVGFRGNERGLDVTIQCNADVPRSVYADEGKLRQILINLLGNSIKFVQTGGVKLFVSMGGGRSEIWFDIIDTGPGIPHDDRERIFRSFEQTGVKKELGTGLGLTISREFAEKMGGSLILLDTPVGQGAHFRLAIPVRRSERIELDDDVELVECRDMVFALEHGRPVRTVIADDVVSNRQLLLSMLADRGLNFVEVEDGQQALNLCRDELPDLILMDIQMPNMDGFTATSAIRRLPGGSEVKIVAVTANAFEEDKERALSVGVDGFVSKPVNETTLMRTLESFFPTVQRDTTANKTEEENSATGDFDSNEAAAFYWSKAPREKVERLLDALLSLSSVEIDEAVADLSAEGLDPADIKARIADFEHEELIAEISSAMDGR
ncbi:MAG TPA: hypothetical protein DDW52_20530 [Planctomycetaceae bacterium]|nr:hypothetical protein [Planctomycetaceae bacterium]